MKKKIKKKKLLKERKFRSYYWRCMVLSLIFIIGAMAENVHKVSLQHETLFSCSIGLSHDPIDSDIMNPNHVIAPPLSKRISTIYCPCYISYDTIEDMMDGTNVDAFSFDENKQAEINQVLGGMSDEAFYEWYPDAAYALAVDEWKYDETKQEYHLENVFFQTSERHMRVKYVDENDESKYIDCITEIPQEWKEKYDIWNLSETRKVKRFSDLKYGDDDYILKADDIYIKDGICHLGKFRLVHNIGRTNEEKTIAECDDTPENAEEYEHCEDVRIILCLGTAPDSENIEKLKALKNGNEPVSNKFNGFYYEDNSRVRKGGFRMPDSERQPTSDLIWSGSEWRGNKYEVTLIGMYGGDDSYIYTETDFFIKVILLPVLIDWIVTLSLLSLLVSLFFYRRYSRLYHEQQKAEYRKTLTNTLAHDLKSPLTAAQGYAENLLENTNPEKNLYYTERIVENIQYTNRIIQDVLELAKIEENDDVPVCEKLDIAKILREMLEDHEEEFEKRSISLKLSDKPFVISANEAMFRQMAVNLTDNTVKYTIDGGVVCLETDGKSLVLKNSCGDGLDVSGNELMQPFVKGDKSRNSRNGSGIGLSIVQKLAECQKIRFDISADKGEFTVKIG